jgi:hypothetical protein
VQDNPRSGQPETQRTDTNVDRVRTLVCSDQRLGVRVTVEELNMNMNRETSATDCKGKFGNEKNFSKNGASNLDT